MSTGTTSANFKKINDQFAIDGVISEETLPFLREHYKSVLYLCPDSADDYGFGDDGFSKVAAAFGADNCQHVPLTLDQPAFEASTPYHFIHALAAYEEFETALDSLEPSTLVMCKSSRRASVVVATYLGVKSSLSGEEVLADSTKQGLSYVSNEALLTWSSLVLSLKRQVKGLVFRQFFEKESSTYTFLLADPRSKEAVIIDPVLETVERDAQQVRQLGLKLKYCLNTHVHADHVTGSGALKEQFSTCKSMISEAAGAKADVKIRDGDKVMFGGRYLTVLSTPGHTNGCVSYLLDDCSMVFTGDALLIRGCGRTDFQQGSAAQLYESVHSKLFILPRNCFVYPGHNYSGVTSSTIGEEKEFNPRLKVGTTCERFEEIMAGLNLPKPAKIDIALPANMRCGTD